MRIRTNSSGKVLTIFLVVIIILSISLAAISIFFFQKEIERRKGLESVLAQVKTDRLKLEAELQDAIKQGFLLQEKNKEADEKINGLLDDLELAEGIREELKLENSSLKEQLEEKNKLAKELQEKSASAAKAEEEISELNQKLQAEEDAKKVLEEKMKAVDQRNKELEEDINRLKQQEAASRAAGQPAASKHEEVELEKIVIAPVKASEGRVLTIDTETEFAIVNLGENHGIAADKILSIYRGDQYIGDIKVTRVQPEMSAADFIPPLTAQRVHKDDRVILKQ
jgi:myosin heavy subunit